MDTKKILSQMTIEEKAILLTGAASMNTAEIKRLGIKPVYMADGPHGVRIYSRDDCIAFPCLSLVGATWNKELIHKMGEALGEDCIEHGINTILGPGINIKRTPLCGRNFEYVSEDPCLSGEIGAAYINGVQSKGVGTCLKHFALNNQEKYRSVASSEADIRLMREIYLRGFEIALKKSNPFSVMCAYNKVNSIYCSENKYLLNDVLKEEWNYDGIVISDWAAVHDICKSVMAGLDLQMPQNGRIVEQINAGLESGAITIKAIDKAVEGILKFIDRNEFNKTCEYDRQKLHKIACDVAVEGTVLLKNRDNILPITKEKNKKIAVLGAFAEDPLTAGQGSAAVNVNAKFAPSPLEELKKRIGDDIEIKYLPIFNRNSFPKSMIWPYTSQWKEFVSDCDAVIVFTGAMDCEDTEQFDRRTIEFNPNYSFVIENVASVNKNVVVVVQSGSAMIFDDWKDKVAGIVQMWLAGEAAGESIVDVLTGKANPSGKLSETFPKVMRTDLEYPGDGLKVCYKEGFDVGYRYYDKHPEEICYPFGYGLSYTSFKTDNFELVQDAEKIQVTANLKNTGCFDGSEVLQLYVSKEESCVSRSPKELKAFEKINLKAGESGKVTLTVDINDLSYFNTCLNKWIVEPGVYKILVGTSSRDIIYTKEIFIDKKAPYTISVNAKTMIG